MTLMETMFEKQKDIWLLYSFFGRRINEWSLHLQKLFWYLRIKIWQQRFSLICKSAHLSSISSTPCTACNSPGCSDFYFWTAYFNKFFFFFTIWISALLNNKIYRFVSSKLQNFCDYSPYCAYASSANAVCAWWSFTKNASWSDPTSMIVPWFQRTQQVWQGYIHHLKFSDLIIWKQ